MRNELPLGALFASAGLGRGSPSSGLRLWWAAANPISGASRLVGSVLALTIWPASPMRWTQPFRSLFHFRESKHCAH